MSAYYRRLTGNDEKAKLECAKAWSKWELTTSRLYVDPSYIARVEADEWALQFARIERLVMVFELYWPKPEEHLGGCCSHCPSFLWVF